MIKRIIQICSMLALTVVFFTVSAPLSANAQTTSRIEAKIPFDFHLGDKTYVAGDYVIKISRISNSTVTMALEDTFGNQLQNALLSTNGQIANGEEQLVFDRYNNERYLSKVLMTSKGFSLHVPEGKKENAKRETVALR